MKLPKKSLFGYTPIFMMKKIIVFLAICCALTGCYESGPQDTATLTVPVTNNPHALPGPMKTSPMPNIF
jgi:hypothetical protein